MLRSAEAADLPGILAVIKEGRRRIRALGIDQWSGGYPGAAEFQEDIARGRCWVVSDKQGIAAVTVVSMEPEEAYSDIQGAWLQTERRYGTIHRVAVADRSRGSGAAVALENLAERLIRRAGGVSVRCDTHLGNQPMNRFLEKMGFTRCGIVVYPDIQVGDPVRVAYEKLLLSSERGE